MFSQLKFSKVWFEWCKSKAWYYLGVHRSQFEMGVGDIHFERRSNEMDVGVVHFKNGESYMPRYIRVAVVTYTRQTAPFLLRTGLSAWTGSVRPTLTQQSNWCTWVCTHTGREILWKPSQKKKTTSKLSFVTRKLCFGQLWKARHCGARHKTLRNFASELRSKPQNPTADGIGRTHILPQHVHSWVSITVNLTFQTLPDVKKSCKRVILTTFQGESEFHN